MSTYHNAYSDLSEEIRERIMFGPVSLEDRARKRIDFYDDTDINELVNGTLRIANKYFPDIMLKVLLRMEFYAHMKTPSVIKGFLDFYNTKLSHILETIDSDNIERLYLSEYGGTPSGMLFSKGTSENGTSLIIGRRRGEGFWKKLLLKNYRYVAVGLWPKIEDNETTLSNIVAELEETFKDQILKE